jgi:hypothetical protein
MKERSLNIIDRAKEKKLVLHDCGGLLDISSEVHEVPHDEGALVVFNG